MIEFEKPNIKCLEIDKDGNYAKVVCEPLERGYGITIGNSLRRILLSSHPGSAITSVKIDGVLHEFSTVKDVVEDVPEIIVNLKGVRLKLDKNEEKLLESCINIPYTQNEMKYLAMMDLTMGKCSYEEFITKMKNL